MLPEYTVLLEPVTHKHPPALVIRNCLSLSPDWSWRGVNPKYPLPSPLKRPPPDASTYAKPLRPPPRVTLCHSLPSARSLYQRPPRERARAVIAETLDLPQITRRRCYRGVRAALWEPPPTAVHYFSLSFFSPPPFP